MKRLYVKEGRSESIYYGMRMYHIFKSLDTHKVLRELNLSISHFAQRGYAMPSLVKESNISSIQYRVLNNSIFGKISNKYIYMQFLKWYEFSGSKEKAYDCLIFNSLLDAVVKTREELESGCLKYEEEIIRVWNEMTKRKIEEDSEYGRICVKRKD